MAINKAFNGQLLNLSHKIIDTEAAHRPKKVSPAGKSAAVAHKLNTTASVSLCGIDIKRIDLNAVSMIKASRVRKAIIRINQ